MNDNTKAIAKNTYIFLGFRKMKGYTMRTIISNYLDGAILEVDADELVDKLYAAGYRKEKEVKADMVEEVL
jgi:hypothetical protein